MFPPLNNIPYSRTQNSTIQKFFFKKIEKTKKKIVFSLKIQIFEDIFTCEWFSPLNDPQIMIDMKTIWKRPKIRTKSNQNPIIVCHQKPTQK